MEIKYAQKNQQQKQRKRKSVILKKGNMFGICVSVKISPLVTISFIPIFIFWFVGRSAAKSLLTTWPPCRLIRLSICCVIVLVVFMPSI